MSTETETYSVSRYDVLRDAGGGWSFNGCTVQRDTIKVLAGAPQRHIERLAREWGGFTGRRTVREDHGDAIRWVDESTAMAVELDMS